MGRGVRSMRGSSLVRLSVHCTCGAVEKRRVSECWHGAVHVRCLQRQMKLVVRAERLCVQCEQGVGLEAIHSPNTC